MVDQTLPEIRQVQEINKAKRYEQKQKEKKDKMETIKDTRAKIKNGTYILTDLNK